jgi:methylmalonyl-CoA mutase C-terminal domain/subunit
MSETIKFLMAKPGLDGHDRGAKVVARSLRESGINVIYTGIRQTPEMIVKKAIEEKVDVIGLSILSGAHMELFPKVIEGLREMGMDKVLVIAGGIIPETDRDEMKNMGVQEFFGPGTNTDDIIQYVRKSVDM